MDKPITLSSWIIDVFDVDQVLEVDHGDPSFVDFDGNQYGLTLG